MVSGVLGAGCWVLVSLRIEKTDSYFTKIALAGNKLNALMP
jgi:hypothetical protein